MARTDVDVRAATIAIVVVGLTLAVVLGLDQGFDTKAIVILVLIAVVGALAIAATGRGEKDAIGPAVCDECAGVISPNAPFCKHCGARSAR